MQTLLYAVLLLAATGLVAAVVLYFIAMKFKVDEDPRIDLVAEKLPGANCGACGKAGCRDLAKALVEGGDPNLICPVCSNEEWAGVADMLGLHADTCEVRIPVVRCQGGFLYGIHKSTYEGYDSCAYANTLHAGENGCKYGCLGLGDCTRSCPFQCLTMDPVTRLPQVNEAICTSCGTCVKACPRSIIELRYKNAVEGRIYVGCRTQDKGAVAMKHCKSACIGCGKCVKGCPVGAITLENNIAYIDFTKCIHCGACVKACPMHAIVNTHPIDPEAAAIAEAAEAATQTASATAAASATASAAPTATNAPTAATATNAATPTNSTNAASTQPTH